MIYGPNFQAPVIKRTTIWIIIVLNAFIKNKNKNYIMNGWNEMNGSNEPILGRKFEIG